jgi:hypothetical protein
MDPLEKLLLPGERLLSFFRADLERVGNGILVLTDSRILWVPETGAETAFEPKDLGWVARNGPQLRLTLQGGSFRFTLATEAAAKSATAYILSCVEKADGEPLSDETQKFSADALRQHARDRGVDIDAERRKLTGEGD